MALVPSRNQYRQKAILNGPTDAVLTLAISTEGSILASGGIDRVRLWDLSAQTEIPSPEHGYVLRGPTSCLLWVRRRDDLRNILAFGTGVGYLVLWRQTDHDQFEECYSRRVANGKEITCLAWDSSNEATLRLANGTRDGCTQLWSFNGKELHIIWSIQLQTTVPKTISFSDSPGADVYVFGIYNGVHHVLCGTEGRIKHSQDINKVVGCSAISTSRNQFVIDNATDGFDLHQLDSGQYIRTLAVGRPRWRLPKQVGFIEDEKLIVGGSDHGMAYVWDCKSGLLLEALQHRDGGLLQTLATYEDEKQSIIAVASSGRSTRISISVWVREVGQPRSAEHRKAENQPEPLLILAILIQSCMIIATAAFIYQNFDRGMQLLPKIRSLQQLGMGGVTKALYTQIFGIAR